MLKGSTSRARTGASAHVEDACDGRVDGERQGQVERFHVCERGWTESARCHVYVYVSCLCARALFPEAEVGHVVALRG